MDSLNIPELTLFDVICMIVILGLPFFGLGVLLGWIIWA